MSKLHHCDDGMLVTDKVLLFQKEKSNDDYIDIAGYYRNFRDRWFSVLQGYMDRDTFDLDYDFKLYKAVISFDGQRALKICSEQGLSVSGAFNRWFYAVLRNWRSNVKTSGFRQKNRPSVTCPVCNRKVTKIDEEHLSHYKTKRDLPKAFSWRGNIYSVVTTAGASATCWGKYSPRKLQAINKKNTKTYDKKSVKWPWFTREGERGVVCPFTKKIVLEINEEHIKKLPTNVNRYAQPYTWYEFIEEFPYSTLIQSEVYTLDYHRVDDDMAFRNSIAISDEKDILTDQDVNNNKTTMEYEHTFFLIESCVEDETNQKILKLASIGYSDEDVSNALDISKQEIRRRKRDIRTSSGELREKLMDSV